MTSCSFSKLFFSSCLMLILGVYFCFSCQTVFAQGHQRVHPRALAISPDNRFVATANRIAGTVSLVSLKNNSVRATLELKDELIDLLWINSKQLVVSSHRKKQLVIIEHQNGKLNKVRSIPLSSFPYGLAFARKQQQVLVTVHHPDEIISFDTNTWKPIRYYSSGAIPRFLLISPDEKWFAVTSELPGAIRCYELTSGKLLSEQHLHGRAFNLGKPVLLSPNHLVVPATINRDFPVTAGNISRGWVVNNRLTLFNVPDGETIEQRQMNLDLPGHGVADLTGSCVNPVNRQLIVLSSGSQEALLLNSKKIQWPSSDPDDFAPHFLTETPGIMKRIPLKGRPIDVKILDQNRALIANELGDSLQLVDTQTAKLLSTISLRTGNSPKRISHHETLIAQGEQIFFDGNRSRDGWLSCHTCHYDGHTSGHLFDTLNDATYDTKKLTLSLHNVADTEPWTWHGWQPDLTEAMAKSLQDTMNSKIPPKREDALALAAYVETLIPISPFHLEPEKHSKEVREGYKIFRTKAGCSHCHQPPNFSAGQRFGVSRVESGSLYQELNPPGLLGVSTRRRFLHHGRAKSLKEVLKLYHRPEDTSGAELSEKELNLLLQFLSVL